MFNAWTAWWNMANLETGVFFWNQDYWQARILHPSAGAFAFSEPQPMTVVLLPLYRVTGSLVLCCNVYLILNLTLNGWFALKLCDSLGLAKFLSAAVAIGCVLHPLALAQISATQLIVLWPVYWTLLGIVSISKGQNGIVCLQLFAALVCLVFTCLYHSLFLGLALAFCLPVLMGHNWKKKAIWVVAVVTAAGLLASPMLLAMKQIHTAHSFERQSEIVAALSASPMNWIAVSGTSMIGLNGFKGFALFPGIGRVLLALIAVFLLPKLSVERRLIICLMLISFALSFGSNIQIGGFNVWDLLTSTVAPLKSIRAPFRFAYLTYPLLLVASAITVQHIIGVLQDGGFKSSFVKRMLTTKTSRMLGSAVVICILGFEVIPNRSLFTSVPLPERKEAWVQHVVENTSERDVLLCLPMASNLSEQALQRESLWMIYQTMHRRPMINGYSGFFPEEWIAFQRKLSAHTWGIGQIETIKERGADYVIVRKDLLPLRKLDVIQGSLRLVFEDSRVAVFSTHDVNDGA